MKRAVFLTLRVMLLTAFGLAGSGEFVLVERGSFTMGNEVGDLWSSTRPAHKVTLTYSFYMNKYEVTFDEYDAFCEATGRTKPYDSGWGRGTRQNASYSSKVTSYLFI